MNWSVPFRVSLSEYPVRVAAAPYRHAWNGSKAGRQALLAAAAKEHTDAAG